YTLIALRQVSCVRLLDFLQRDFFRGVVCSPNLVRALEGHVLEHVRHTGLAQRILHRARIHVSEESKYGGLRTLADHHGEAVIQLFDRDAFLERSKVLGEGYSGKHHEQWQGSENAVFHRASSADWDQTRRENLKLRSHCPSTRATPRRKTAHAEALSQWSGSTVFL